MRGPYSALVFATPLAALTCLGLCFFPCQKASADVHLVFGTKWDPLRYTTAAFPFASSNANAPASLSGLTSQLGGSGFQTTSLDPYVGVFFAQRYGVLLSLDIGYGKLSQDTTPAGGTLMSDNNSFFQFGFALGYKMYLNQPRRERISPYLYVDFFKYFASITSDTPGSQQAAPYAAGLLSPVGASFAFGAEYFVTPGFSIGSEVFGLKVADVGSDYTTTPATGMTAGTHIGTSYTYVTFYTGITLNYRFQIQTSVNVAEENETADEDAAPAKKKKKVKAAPASDEDNSNAAPPAPPPPSPEAVD
jgi:hypothetical protein